ncbi:hypothetical protein Hbor_37410 (plasmid) [Halogeometricum borinquense DSM 11551]|nr:hypothetical protein Hbor_37410 [Halogeometricum borinquense DSM 11551]
MEVSGLTIAGLASMGAVSADPGSESTQKDRKGSSAVGKGWIKAQGNKVKLNVTQEEIDELDISDFPEAPEGAKLVTLQEIQLQVGAINEKIESGELKIASVNSNGVPEVKRANKNGESDK